MKKVSGGIVLYRKRDSNLEVLLLHMGGPFWAKKDNGAWSIPKGEVEEGENILETAKREFEEETGFKCEGEVISLGSIVQKGGKEVHAWVLEGDLDLSGFKPDTFTMEWPPKSGKMQEFPENDKADYFPLEIAQEKIIESQRIFLDRLTEIIS